MFLPRKKRLGKSLRELDSLPFHREKKKGGMNPARKSDFFIDLRNRNKNHREGGWDSTLVMSGGGGRGGGGRIVFNLFSVSSSV